MIAGENISAMSVACCLRGTITPYPNRFPILFYVKMRVCPKSSMLSGRSERITASGLVKNEAVYRLDELTSKRRKFSAWFRLRRFSLYQSQDLCALHRA